MSHFHVYVQIKGGEYYGGCAESWIAALRLLGEMDAKVGNVPLRPHPEVDWFGPPGAEDPPWPCAAIKHAPGGYEECTWQRR